MCNPSFDAALADRLTTWREQASLSPAVASVATGAIDHRSQPLSLLLTLVRVSADASTDSRHSQTRCTLLDVSTAVVALSGYARLRAEVLDIERELTARERDVAILASDYLHAFAHASLGSVSLSADCHVELYRTLTAGSDALATRFLDDVTEPATAGEAQSQSNRDRGRDRTGNTETTDAPLSSPIAVLAGTGCALGSVAAGASRDLAEAMQMYGESVLTVLECVDTGDGKPLALTERVLTDHEPAHTHRFDRIDGGGAGSEVPELIPGAEANSSPKVATGRQSESMAKLIPPHLERARTALESVPETDAKVRLERVTAVLASTSAPHDDTETP